MSGFLFKSKTKDATFYKFYHLISNVQFRMVFVKILSKLFRINWVGYFNKNPLVFLFWLLAGFYYFEDFYRFLIFNHLKIGQYL
ncbi:hypothetical protein BXU10_06930 [Flavobacterium sp. LM4]|nr:hypothetical protein BXU10_06930 [Flavobacterium sp. LM4]